MKAEKFFQKAKTIIESDEMKSERQLKVSLEKFNLSIEVFKEIKWSLTAYEHFQARFHSLRNS